MSILQTILEHKRGEIEAAKKEVPLTKLRSMADRFSPRGFAKNLLAGVHPRIIAEIKRASPSKGVIRADLEPIYCATAYAEGGAGGLSILTDEKFFSGSLEFLRRVREALTGDSSVGLLRKDFIIDPYQVWQSREAGADALLLIVAALEQKDLELLLETCLAAEIDVLLEVHTREELDRVFSLRTLDRFTSESSSQLLLGINNRDLNTFQVALETTQVLAAQARKREPRLPIISESGILSAKDLQTLRAYHADAFLIGEYLVRKGDPGENLSRLRSEYIELIT